MSNLDSCDRSPRVRPYPHQVGGHGQLAMTNSGRLLKPLLKKEHAFYQYIHSDALPIHLRWLRMATPKYYGEADLPTISSPCFRSPSPPPASRLQNATSNSSPCGTTSTSTSIAEMAPTVTAISTTTASASVLSALTPTTTAMAIAITTSTVIASPPELGSTPPSARASSFASSAPASMQNVSKVSPDAMVITPSLERAAATGLCPRWRSVTNSPGGTAELLASISPWAAAMRTRLPNPPTPPSPPVSPASNPPSSPPSVNIPSPPPARPGGDSEANSLMLDSETGPGGFDSAPTANGIASEMVGKSRRRSIALEDVNSVFHVPCVMDCKIGTRSYDDDASAEKRRRHIAKAIATTSAKCGVRFTGMQSFKRTNAESRYGVFETTNKYHGRTLCEDDLVPEATWFFHDNLNLRVDCVAMILERLVQLRVQLVKQNHFYFYSSSLLLVYEGEPPNFVPPRVDVRMIDFAHTVLSKGHCDEGYLKGIDYLICVLSEILQHGRDGNIRLPGRAQLGLALEGGTAPDDAKTNGTNGG